MEPRSVRTPGGSPVARETAIGATESAGELHDRLARVACDALDATLQLHEKDPLPPGQPQDESQASKAPKLKKADGYLRVVDPAARLARQIRAYWPWPGARSRFVAAQSGDSVEVMFVTATNSATLDGPGSRARPGTILADLTVATGEGALEIHGLQPAGRKPMSWQDFVNGRHVKPGDRFETIAECGPRS
jgi:methionyl-tRNA formyltransferase